MKKRRSSAMSAALLALEAQHVIALRMMKFAVGGEAAKPEARRMVNEKVDAAQKAAGIMAAAWMRGSPDRGADAVVRMLRQRVGANRKRLSK
jgi:hypothetical protein